MTVSNLQPLTASEIQQMAVNWFAKLDVHAPLEEFAPFLIAEDLEMRFPEGTVKGFDGFKGWYERVTRIFFDEVHTLKQANAIPKAERSEVKVIVKWEASVWKPPASKSERIITNAYQTWEVQRSPETGKPAIVTYIVDNIEYYEGSARL